MDVLVAFRDSQRLRSTVLRNIQQLLPESLENSLVSLMSKLESGSDATYKIEGVFYESVSMERECKYEV